MSLFIKIYEDALLDQKLIQVGNDGFAMWTRGMLWSKKMGTEGFMPSEIIPLISMCVKSPKSTVKSLIDAGLWVKVEGGYALGVDSKGVDKWSKHQVSNEEIETKKAQATKRKREQRERERAELEAEIRTRILAETKGETRGVTEGDVTQMSRVTDSVTDAGQERDEGRDQQRDGRVSHASVTSREPTDLQTYRHQESLITNSSSSARDPSWPTRDEVDLKFQTMAGTLDQAAKFWFKFEAIDWQDGSGNPIRDWRRWVRRFIDDDVAEQAKKRAQSPVPNPPPGTAVSAEILEQTRLQAEREDAERAAERAARKAGK